MPDAPTDPALKAVKDELETFIKAIDIKRADSDARLDKIEKAVAEIEKKVSFIPAPSHGLTWKAISAIISVAVSLVASLTVAAMTYQKTTDKIENLEDSVKELKDNVRDSESRINAQISDTNKQLVDIGRQVSEIQGQVSRIRARVGLDPDAGVSLRGNFHNYWCDVDNHDADGWRGFQTTNRSDGSQLWFYAIPDRGIVQGTDAGPVDAGVAPNPPPVIATSRTSWGLSPPGAHVGLNVTINGRWFCYEYVERTLRPTDCRFTDAGTP